MIVHQNIQLPKTLHRFFDAVVGKTRLLQIPAQQKRPAAELFNPFRRLRGIPLFVIIHQHDRRALLYKVIRDRPSDPAVAARDQRHFVFQLTASFPTF